MKKILPLFLMLFWSFNVSAVETPQKFKNPIFNGNLSSEDEKMAHDLRLTPTHIYDFVSEDFDEDCDYVTEDDKAILLKCHQGDQEKPNYEMFFIRYQASYAPGGYYRCRIWGCRFEGKDTPKATRYSSDMHCPDELKKHPRDEKIPAPDCLKELQARGWDKYFPSNKK